VLAGSVWVPKGSSADPLMQTIAGMSTNTPGKGFLIEDEKALQYAAPGVTSTAGKALGAAGVGLTFYSTGAEQWAYDSEHHPGWSTTHKVIDTAQTTVVVGGATAGGAWVGAEAGAEGGAVVGASIGSAVPVVGTLAGGVVGAVVGGVGGGIAGGEVGKQIGHGAEWLGHEAGHLASDVWNAVF
jgi:phage tail tape-measure protein